MQMQPPYVQGVSSAKSWPIGLLVRRAAPACCWKVAYLVLRLLSGCGLHCASLLLTHVPVWSADSSHTIMTLKMNHYHVFRFPSLLQIQPYVPFIAKAVQKSLKNGPYSRELMYLFCSLSSIHRHPVEHWNRFLKYGLKNISIFLNHSWSIHFSLGSLVTSYGYFAERNHLSRIFGNLRLYCLSSGHDVPLFLPPATHNGLFCTLFKWLPS